MDIFFRQVRIISNDILLVDVHTANLVIKCVKMKNVICASKNRVRYMKDL